MFAQHQFSDALRLGRASGDKTFEGHVIALLANQALRTEQFQAAIECTDAALLLDNTRLTPALRADLYCLAAEAHANLGNARLSFVNVKKAEEEVARTKLEDEPPETRHLTPDVVVGRNAVIHRRLGFLREAGQYFDQIDATSASHPRASANRLAARLDFLIAAGEPDQAAAVGMELLTASENMESWLLRSRIVAAGEQLAPHKGIAAVRAFCERARQQHSLLL